MKIEYPILHLLVLFAIFLLLWPTLRSSLLTLRPRQGDQARKPKTPRPLKPKTGDDCPLCRAEKGASRAKPGGRPTPPPWCEVRSRRGRKKRIPTQGYACNHLGCIYYHCMDELIHALVGYGSHGKQEKIQDLICQACGKKFTVRRDTVLYRLKTHSEKVAQALALMAEGVDVSTLERVMGIGEGTLRTWLTRAGLHAQKLHDSFFHELIFRHIQLDELWANVRHATEQMWLWVATEATTKVIPVLKLGPRTLDVAMSVIHELCQRMPSDCWPIFTSDGLKLYFYALTAHVGHWVLPQGAHKPVWEIAAGFLYAQVKKIHRQRRLVKIEHHVLGGDLERLTTGLKALGLTGKINTAFIERLNLTIRQGVAFLLRRTWGTAQFAPELALQVQWWRGYYHFARYHESLRIKFSQPVQRKGKQTPRWYRSRTPATCLPPACACLPERVRSQSGTHADRPGRWRLGSLHADGLCWSCSAIRCPSDGSGKG
jgi:IS1 family transposase